ncbi:hypothetical protein [Rhodobacter sp. CZR27]|uniref:hypothetical protein n=1 Tax=Rhodobacter sp. CZR27 TaxID=2033869 RepID=UPI000BBEFDE2|nr:hypothetical protein [Rhodobacter sp. CZR27]
MPGEIDRRIEDFDALRATLAKFHLTGLEGRIARAAGDYLEAHGHEILPPDRAEPLSVAERAALASVGVAAGGEADPQPALALAARHAVLAETALPLAQAADRLGVDPSRLRQRLRERTILGIRRGDERGWRIPGFQFTPEGELPGLRGVLRAIRPDAAPVIVAAFFTTPQADLEDAEGQSLTPAAWLAAGHDPGPVRDLAAAI